MPALALMSEDAVDAACRSRSQRKATKAARSRISSSVRSCRPDGAQTNSRFCSPPQGLRRNTFFDHGSRAFLGGSTVQVLHQAIPGRARLWSVDEIPGQLKATLSGPCVRAKLIIRGRDSAIGAGIISASQKRGGRGAYRRSASTADNRPSTWSIVFVAGSRRRRLATFLHIQSAQVRLRLTFFVES